jgi:hypothetical protein
VPERLRRRAFRGSWAVRAGLLTPRQLRGRNWRRLYPDVYVHRDLDVTHAVRARVAAGVLLPEAVVSGRSAAVLWGVGLADADDDVELTRPSASHPVRVPGLRVRRAGIAPELVRRRHGVRVTSPEATAVRLACCLPLEEAVIAVDRLTVSGIVDLGPIRDLASSVRGAGSARARRAVALADGLAESPQETRLRLLLGTSGLPMPVAQYRVVVDGRSIARVDFAWPDRKIALEYDGLWHAEPGQFARDRQRLNRLRAAGWQVVFVTAVDMRHPEELVARIEAALVG